MYFFFISSIYSNITINFLDFLINKFKNKKLNCYLQVSMDGPNVNWRFYDMLKARRRSDDLPSLLDLGSCGLHVINGAFMNGITKMEWKIDKMLSCAYWMFNTEWPGRLEDYTTLSGSTDYPFQFCKTRWVENTKLASRLLTILPYIRAYKRGVVSKQVTKPTCQSYDTLVKWLSDPLINVKIQVFWSLAREVEPFLTMYQTHKPMVPFLFADLTNMVKSVLGRILKPDKVAASDVVKIDLDNETTMPADLGFAAEKEIKVLLHKRKIIERDVLDVRTTVKSGIIKMVKKLQEKSPLKYQMFQSASCLDPREMSAAREKCETNFTRLLVCLEKAERLTDAEWDAAKSQYRKFLNDVATDDKFNNFYRSAERLDKLLFESIGSCNEYSMLWKVVKFPKIRLKFKNNAILKKSTSRVCKLFV